MRPKFFKVKVDDRIHLTDEQGNPLARGHQGGSTPKEIKDLKRLVMFTDHVCSKCCHRMLRSICKVEIRPYSGDLNYTFEPEEVLPGHDNETGEYTHQHKDGWTIQGVIKEDYYYWVDEFVAHHPKYGFIFGCIENVVWAETQEGYEHFIERHKPKEWDKGDI